MRSWRKSPGGRSRRVAALTALCVVVSMSVIAQTKKADVGGRVRDYETGEGIPAATLQWLALPDSSLTMGATTALDGSFSMTKKVAVGNYLLRVSYVGYETLQIPFTINKKGDNTVRMDTIVLKSDAIMLKEALIEAQIAEVQVVEDTIMFNAEAFRVPEGSVLEELLKKMPGVEIGEDGSITVNGRKVDRLLVGGEEFFGNNREIATRTFPQAW